MGDGPENLVLQQLGEMRALLEKLQDDMKSSVADTRAEIGDVRAELANLRVETRRGMADLLHDVRELSVAIAALNQGAANVETTEQ
jgi:hypothetical protein